MKSVKDIPVEKLLGIKVKDSKGEISTVILANPVRTSSISSGYNLIVLKYNDGVSAHHHHTMHSFFYTE